MKINVNLTIEVDPEVWNMVYGGEETPAQIRQSVKASVVESVTQHYVNTLEVAHSVEGK